MNNAEVGRRIISEVLGPAHLERREKSRNSFNTVLSEYSDEVCFGRIWAREGIDRKQRSIINLAMLVALNRPAQLKHHLEGALNNGCTVAEIQEILLQSAMYCGLPAAVDGFKVAEEVLKAHNLID